MIEDRISILLGLSEFGLDINGFYNVSVCQTDVSLQGYMNRDNVDKLSKFGITLTSASNGFLYGEFYTHDVKIRIVLT